MIGEQVENFRVVNKLGEGGMGVVYKAMDVQLERPVAIKMLTPELSRNPEIVERFRTEARAQANLNHTNLATLYAFLVHEGSAFIVMEFVEGENFEQIISRCGPLAPEDAIPWFKQALLGVGAAHRMGIVHRDLKPANLMLNRQGIVKVMDFGIAKVLGVRGITRTGMQLGTAAYMSPEQIRGLPVDSRADIYALGITLYQMLSGHVPFEHDSDFDIMHDQVNTPPPQMISLNPYAPARYQTAVMRALEKNPEDRYRSVEEFGAALERPDPVTAPIAGTTRDFPRQTGTPLPMTPTPGSATPASTSGRWNPRQLMAALIVLVAAVLLGVMLYARKPSPTPISPGGGGANTPPVQPQGSGTLNPSGGGNGAAGSGNHAGERSEANFPPPLKQGRTKITASNQTMQGGGTMPLSGPADQPPRPAVDPKLLRDLETENDQLDSRAAAVEGSLDTLERQMQQSGYGLRGDMVAARDSMRRELQQARQSIGSADPERARHYLDLAHRDVEKLEAFLGRR